MTLGHFSYHNIAQGQHPRQDMILAHLLYHEIIYHNIRLVHLPFDDINLGHLPFHEKTKVWHSSHIMICTASYDFGSLFIS